MGEEREMREKFVGKKREKEREGKYDLFLK